MLLIAGILGAVGLPANPKAMALARTFCRNDSLPQTHDVLGLETVHILYASDAGGFVGLLSSMLSVARNLRDPRSTIIHLVVPVEDQPLAADLVSCFEHELDDLSERPKVVLHEALDLTFDLGALDSEWILKSRLRFVKSTWVRMYMDRYLMNVRRVIYLDTDTIVNADLAPMYRMRMQSAVAASWEPPLHYRACFANKGLPIQGNVSWSFNAGVLLVDLERYVSLGVLQEMEKWINATGGCWGDQLALTLGLRGEVDPLPWAWHVKGIGGHSMMMFQQPCLDLGNVFHWTGGDGSVKQWLPTRRKALDWLFMPYAPKRRCAALPAGHLLQEDFQHTEL